MKMIHEIIMKVILRLKKEASVAQEVMISAISECEQYRDAAEFEARVASKLAVSPFTIKPCVVGICPRNVDNCPYFMTFKEESIPFCRLLQARLVVESEMEEKRK